MTPNCIASTQDLIDRADRAIAEAAATRAEVRVGLLAAWRNRPCQAGPRARPSPPSPLKPMPLDGSDPWWSVARALADAGAIVQRADAELDRAWQRVRPTLETPPTLFEG